MYYQGAGSVIAPGITLPSDIPVGRPYTKCIFPLPGPRGRAMYRDVRVPRVQDAYERPSAALILGSTVGAKNFEVLLTCRPLEQAE
jgi:hypothetical protein